MDYDATYATVRGALLDGVFGPPKKGVYSPSVQYTLYQMAHMALERAPQVIESLRSFARFTQQGIRIQWSYSIRSNERITRGEQKLWHVTSGVTEWVGVAAASQHWYC
jgi:urate oxidase